MTPTRRFLLILAITAGFAYSSWVLAPLLGTQLHPVTSYASELAARNQPLHWVYRTADSVTMVIWALMAGRLVHVRNAWVRRGAWSLAAMALFTMGDVTFTMACTPTADPVCARREIAGLLPIPHYVHTYMSSAVGICLVAAMVFLTIAVWRGGSRLRGVVVTLALFTTLTLAWSALSVVWPWWLGVAQRAQLTGQVIWLVLAVLALRDQDLETHHRA